MAFESPTPDVGIVRISFRSSRALARDELTSLSEDIVANVPVAPSEIVIDPRGAGWVDYDADDNVTLDDLTHAVTWLRQHPLISEVSWTTVIDSQSAT